MRLNARLPKLQAHHLQELRAATGETISDVIRTAIDRYHAQVFESRAPAARILEETGFLGCGEAEADLSTRYRDRWEEGLDRKHGHR